MEIQGYCHPAFSQVRDEFERNFTERGDVGASAHIIVEGESVVHLWGGVADPEQGSQWQEDTIAVVMSATKGATALCAHILADRGLLDFDAPVATYWPEFAAEGKDAITVRMLLNHQAGLPSLRHPLPEGAYCNWDLMVDALANEAPHWEPGTRAGYHAFTFGWLVGEVIRRVSGRTPGTFFREEIGRPLDLDFWMGLPESEHDRVAPLLVNPEDPVLEAIASNPDPDSPLNRAFSNMGGYTRPGHWNAKASLLSEICAAGGVGNARALSRMYAPLAHDGAFEGIGLVSPETIARMGAVQSAVMAEHTVNMPFRMTLGYFSEGTDAGLPETLFGHDGWGGSMGFADPDARMSFGYVMNQMNTTPRWTSLAGAAYRALGYRQGKFGVWMR